MTRRFDYKWSWGSTLHLHLAIVFVLASLDSPATISATALLLPTVKVSNLVLMMGSLGVPTYTCWSGCQGVFWEFHGGAQLICGMLHMHVVVDMQA